MLNQEQLVIKRIFDIIVSFIILLFLAIPIIVVLIISSILYKKSGIFCQQRVGQNSKVFTIFKIRTIRSMDMSSDLRLEALDRYGITVNGDKRISPFGQFLRRYKLDELPQLVNVLIGDMSLVGPRPDVVGYADVLKGDDRIVLSVKPGITGPATLNFRNEEFLLSKQEDPIRYNNEVIWPQKVNINIRYIQTWSLRKDIYYMFKTIFS